MKNENRKYDLEERLVVFAVNVLNLAEKLPNTRAGNHIAGQITRSGTAPALNYGEAKGGRIKKRFHP